MIRLARPASNSEFCQNVRSFVRYVLCDCLEISETFQSFFEFFIRRGVFDLVEQADEDERYVLIHRIKFRLFYSALDSFFYLRWNLDGTHTME